jgi:hypothetical protein
MLSGRFRSAATHTVGLILRTRHAKIRPEIEFAVGGERRGLSRRSLLVFRLETFATQREKNVCLALAGARIEIL